MVPFLSSNPLVISMMLNLKRIFLFFLLIPLSIEIFIVLLQLTFPSPTCQEEIGRRRNLFGFIVKRDVG
jgi:hypothetical protein